MRVIKLTAINLLTRLGSIGPVLETDECEALRSPRFSIFGQEDAGDAAEALEDLAEVVLLCHLGHLCPRSPVSRGSRSPNACPLDVRQHKRRVATLTLVTRKVARSSLSYFPPIFSPVAPAPPFLRCMGTYTPLAVPNPPSFDPAASPSTPSAPAAAPPTAPSTPSGAKVSLNGHFMV